MLGHSEHFIILPLDIKAEPPSGVYMQPKGVSIWLASSFVDGKTFQLKRTGELLMEDLAERDKGLL